MAGPSIGDCNYSFTGVAIGNARTQTVANISGSFTVPDCVFSITVVCIGGGGGASVGQGRGDLSGGGGGGGGAMASGTLAVTPGESFDYVVGSGGPGGLGTNGGLTEFPTNREARYIYATGGFGTENSGGADGGAVADSRGDLKNAGGGGGNGTRYGGGGGGGSGGTAVAATGNNGVDGVTNAGGAGGAALTGGGSGGAGGGQNTNGSNAVAPGGGGGGGGGGNSNGIGGNGAAGRVTITWNSTAFSQAMMMNVMSGVLVVGGNVEIRVLFNQPVVVTGAPSITISVGNNQRQANYVSGSGTRELLFRYQVVAGDVGSSGVVTASSISLNGGTIKDNCNEDAVLDIGVITSTANVPNSGGLSLFDFFGQTAPEFSDIRSRFTPNMLGD